MLDLWGRSPCVTVGNLCILSYVTAQQKVSRNVRALLAIRDLRVSDVSRALGVGTDAIYAKIKGHRGWTLDELEALARLFDVGVADLLRDPADAYRGSPSGGTNKTVSSGDGWLFDDTSSLVQPCELALTA